MWLKIYSEGDTAIALSIPLSESLNGDSWYWLKDKDDIYYVWSAYQLLQTLKGNYLSDAYFGFWKKFWQLKVPRKMKDLVWRELSKCLPMRYNLGLKHVEREASCLICGIYVKIDVHCSVSCRFVWDYWECTGLSSGQRFYTTVSDLFGEVMEGLMLQDLVVW